MGKIKVSRTLLKVAQLFHGCWLSTFSTSLQAGKLRVFTKWSLFNIKHCATEKRLPYWMCVSGVGNGRSQGLCSLALCLSPELAVHVGGLRPSRAWPQPALQREAKRKDKALRPAEAAIWPLLGQLTF